jgi:hypothetical protein
MNQGFGLSFNQINGQKKRHKFRQNDFFEFELVGIARKKALVWHFGGTGILNS